MMDKFFKSDYKPKRKTIKGWNSTSPVDSTVKLKGQEAKSGYRTPHIKWNKSKAD